MLLILLFFNLSPGKRGVYLLPAVPLLVLALAPLLPGLRDKRGSNWLATGFLVFLGGAMGVAGILGWAGFEPLAEQAAKHDASPWLWWTMLGLSMVGLLIWLKPRRGAMALSLWLGFLWPTFGLLAWPDMNDSRSPRDLMQDVVEITGPDAWLALHDFGEEFLLHTRQPTVDFGYHSRSENEFLSAIDWLLIGQEDEGVIDCMDIDRARNLGFQNSQYWWLIPGTAASGCEGDAKAAPVFAAPTSLRRSPYL